jgi:hypothetical protein
MRLRIVELCCLGSCVLAGCAASGPRAGDVPGVAIGSPDRVTVYASPVQVGERYREIAVLVPGRDYSPGSDEYTQMRQRAFALGANGIILSSSQAPAAPAQPTTDYVLSELTTGGERVVAILVGDGRLSADSKP